MSVPRRGWTKSGCIYDAMGRWSIAWRLHDAQFWGVPQRRKRIALVADFNGQCAPEVLFERKGLHGDSAESGKTREGNTGRIEEGTDRTKQLYENHGTDGRVTGPKEINPTIERYYGTGGNNTPLILQPFGEYRQGETGSTLKKRDYKGETDIICNARENTVIVRRETPEECEMLQGYPVGWTDIGAWTDSNGKYHKSSTDSDRMKAIGDSIALPFWKVLAKKISAQYDRDITMGSLFDGIGGFPYVFEQINGKGTARWASEIAEFSIAVTKFHFGEE